MRMIFFDIETGGLDIGDPIIQIAAAVVQTENWQVVGQREWKCLFDEKQADPQALSMNHYDPDVWAREAVELDLAMTEFNQLCKHRADVSKISIAGRPYYVAQLAGYNTEKFDMPRMQHYFSQTGQFFSANLWTYDVLQLCRWKLLHRTDIPDHKLPTLCEKFGIEHNAHDAMGDVLATVELTRRMLHE